MDAGGGIFQTDYAPGMGCARLWWLPWLCGSPDVAHIGPNVGSGSFTATFTLPSGETRGVAKPYRAIEPIRRLVCSEIDGQYSCVYNPSRLVYEHPARLKVGANGNFSPHEVEWRVVSGPGVVTRDEDEFGDVGWGATVTATAESGEVVVEARFNEDAIQPRFVLPIVRERRIPIKAYFICDANGEGVISQVDLESKIQYANVVWRQTGVVFYLSSQPIRINAPQYLDLPEHNTVTNAHGVLVPGKGVSQAVQYLLSQTQSDGCVKVLSVQSFTDSAAAAFTLRSARALLLSGVGNMRVLAHELGHILGLDDIYEYRKTLGGRIEMTGLNEHIAKECFSDGIKDWGAETDRGFYPATDTQCVIVQALLMYGYDNAGVASAVDLPSGGARGLSATANHPFSTTNICVGANFITE